MSWTKVIASNFLVFFALLGVAILIPGTAVSILKLKKTITADSSGDPRAGLPVYDHYDWARIHFAEFASLETRYKDYVTWTREDFSGETINIINGERYTSVPQNQTGPGEKSQLLFFGGSTVWGTGVNDANTLASITAQNSDHPTRNLGESGYISRQSVSRLVNHYIRVAGNKRPTARIIFYDGVNDVAIGCRREVAGLASSRETQIQAILTQRSEFNKWTIWRPFEQFQEFLSEVSNKLFVNDRDEIDDQFVCDNTQARAREVASNLVAAWQMAKKMTSSNGDEFIPILQPVAFVGEPLVDYLNLKDPANQELKKQFDSVYPLIKSEARKQRVAFIDLTNAYDGEENIYIDFCHVGPKGHQIIAARLLKEIDLLRSD